MSMLRRAILQGSAALLFLLVADVAALEFTKPELCVQTCFEASANIAFGDYDPTADYYSMRCNSRLLVSSIYVCYNQRCSDRYSVDSSFTKLEWFCEEYGFTPLNGTYEDVMKDVVAEFGSIDNVPVINPVTFTEVVNTTVSMEEAYWDLAFRTLDTWEHEMYIHAALGWGLYVMAAGVVFFGVVNRIMAYVVHRLLARRPLSGDAERSAAIVGKGAAPDTGLFNKVHNLWAKHIVLPATFGYRHIQPWGWCTIPTRMQSILVFAYFALNFIFCAIDWREFPGNTYWDNPADQFWRYFADRTGIISFANLPLVWLFAGRNDVLMWLTGWSFSTFNVFHRYSARIATVQGILHSIAYTIIYYRGSGDWSGYNTEIKEQWFWTGVAATILMSVLIGLSVLPLRAKVYELFLAIHVSFSVVILLFLFLHVKIMDGEYDGYLWTCAGFWIFDRFLRLVRIGVLNYRVFISGKNDPLKRSQATATYDADGDIIRLTVRPSVNLLVGAGIHYYIYTPTSSGFRLWENHPFTLGSWYGVPAARADDTPAHESALPASGPTSPISADSKSDSKSISSGGRDIELHPTQQELMFLVRPYKGMTNTLKKQLLKAPGHTKDMRVLIEGPYGSPADLRQYERVLMISGGSGVTGILAYLYEFEQHARAGKAAGRTMRFVWAAREPAFVADVVSKDLGAFVTRADTRLDFYMTQGTKVAPGLVESALERAGRAHGSSIDTEKSEKAPVGGGVYEGRPDLAALLDEEISQLVGDTGRLAVVVCGPGRLADDVRYEVVKAIGSKIDASRIELHEESFGW